MVAVVKVIIHGNDMHRLQQPLPSLLAHVALGAISISVMMIFDYR